MRRRSRFPQSEFLNRTLDRRQDSFGLMEVVMTQHRSSACCRSVAITLMVLLLCQSGLAMQATSGLRLVVIEGNGAQYTVEQVPENTITVRLVDRDNRPVPDVGVVFA